MPNCPRKEANFLEKSVEIVDFTQFPPDSGLPPQRGCGGLRTSLWCRHGGQSRPNGGGAYSPDLYMLCTCTNYEATVTTSSFCPVVTGGGGAEHVAKNAGAA
jgi:hypothetical protein